MMENKKKKDGWNLSKLKSEKCCVCFTKFFLKSF